MSTDSAQQFNLAQLHEHIAAIVPDREALVFRDRRLSFADITERTRRLANFFLAQGVTLNKERSECENWESGQDHVALYLHNGTEYLESMLGALKARAVPCNINYRYVEEELLYILLDSQAKAIIYHAAFAPRLATILDKLPQLQLLIQVQDESGHDLLPGAIDYEQALASVSAAAPALEYHPDDLYMIYTGGTTGMPKGVLWRQGDLIPGPLGGRRSDGSVIHDIEVFTQRASRGNGFRFLTTPPLMHGSSQWTAFNAWLGGNTVVMQSNVLTLDPKDILETLEREKINVLLIVGDAFAKPLVNEMQENHYDLSSMKNIISGGAILNPRLKQGLIDCIPQVKIVNNMGSSESGTQASQISSAGKDNSETFRLSSSDVVLNAEMTAQLPSNHAGLGWLAKKGYVPLGYLGDEEKTQKTFPQVDGVRHSIPGDRVKLLDNGIIEFHGRDSVTINSGGEKIFAEEVELAIKHHQDVFDVVVTGRPHEKWGHEVVAIIQLCKQPDSEPKKSPTPLLDREGILGECARHIAKYKHPKAFLIVDQLLRSPNGKPDYRWAKEQAKKAS